MTQDNKGNEQPPVLPEVPATEPEADPFVLPREADDDLPERADDVLPPEEVHPDADEVPGGDTGDISPRTDDVAPSAPLAPPRRGMGGFLAALLGGVFAAAVGFGAGYWLNRDGSSTAVEDLTARLASQESAVAALAGRFDAIPAAPDLAPLREEIATLRADFVSQTDGLRPALDALAGRVEALERAPSPDGTLSATALAAWQAELDNLRADLAAQSDRVNTLAAEAAARIDATADNIAQIEAQATTAALEAARRGAVLRIVAALDAGTPFADVLADVGNVPPTLAALAESGAPTLAQLRAAFPEAARAALTVARAEGLSGEEGGVWGFLRSQFDVRSTAPRDGDDPDAVLSRSEAALAGNDLDAALAEIATLPEVVRGAMGEWLTLAETRRMALAEAAALSETLTEN